MATQEEKYQCVCWYTETQSDTQVQENFRTKYKKNPPSQTSIRSWHKEFEKTGSIQNEKRSKCASNKKTFNHKPKISVHTLQVKEQCVSWFNEFKSVTVVQRKFRTKYKTKAPSRKTILAWHQKFMETGNFLYKKGSGRPRMSEEVVESIHKAFLQNPTISIRGAAKLLNLANSTVHRMLQTRILPSTRNSDSSTKNLQDKE